MYRIDLTYVFLLKSIRYSLAHSPTRSLDPPALHPLLDEEVCAVSKDDKDLTDGFNFY